MQSVLNVSAYLFTPLDDRVELQKQLRERTRDSNLKGTILLAPEGINLFLAGEPVALRAFLDGLRAQPRFAALGAKESWSQDQPFRKMLVKLKNEIIRMDHPTIRPSAGRAPAVTPSTLRRWLDQGHDDDGREVVMLDTRNAFEIGYGTFTDSLNWQLTRFTQFPQAALDHRSDLEEKTVVSFCTGGIRCEKAAIYLQDVGLSNVHQLEGGILQYFEEVGGAHFEGDCFVFDEREALRPDLGVWEHETRLPTPQSTSA